MDLSPIQLKLPLKLKISKTASNTEHKTELNFLLNGTVC